MLNCDFLQYHCILIGCQSEDFMIKICSTIDFSVIVCYASFDRLTGEVPRQLYYLF